MANYKKDNSKQNTFVPIMIDEQLIQQGEQKGREEALKEMARTLLLSGVDKETIMTATGFTSRELELLSH